MKITLDNTPVDELAQKMAGIVESLGEIFLNFWTVDEWSTYKPQQTIQGLLVDHSLENALLKFRYWSELHCDLKEHEEFTSCFRALIGLKEKCTRGWREREYPPILGPYLSPSQIDGTAPILLLDESDSKLAISICTWLPIRLRNWAERMAAKVHGRDASKVQGKPGPEVSPREREAREYTHEMWCRYKPTVRKPTRIGFVEWAKKEGIRLPTNDPEQLHRMLDNHRKDLKHSAKHAKTG